MTDASHTVKPARQAREPKNGITYWPEFNVALFAVLLNWPWEFMQVPLYEGMPGAQHWQGIKVCTQATFGDAVIMLAAYSAVAMGSGRYWLLQPTPVRLLAFVALGLAVTAVIETLALSGTWFVQWTYSDEMPRVPLLGIGLAPFLQWILIPLLVIWFCRRQIGDAFQHTVKD
ncbi:hypothetical protein JI739_19520 [Ramlibacter sp. AW1]|uniref:Uncharacterized protein n=1 Tax=Ramlibacter aurantiacus TaxID=2801330 RepID=A0A936ZRZ2_9BURK|nr:hypothetical protein [Ramlibacter aurantiacus]MBL0422545.1 hypothetical protein [Ramlibacter aurantiacus]